MKKKSSLLVRIFIIVILGSIIILLFTLILNTGIGTSASVFKAQKCSRYVFTEYSNYVEQSLEILLEAKIDLELSGDYSPNTVAYVFGELEIKQKELEHPECAEQYQAAQINYLHHQALAFSAKTEKGFFSKAKYWYHAMRAECYLNLTILIQTIIMPSVPPSDTLEQNANLNIYYLGRDST